MPRSRARRIAASWPGTTATSGLSHSGTPGEQRERNVCLLEQIRIVGEDDHVRPRAATSPTASRIDASAGPVGATASTGQPRPIAATGPCIRSAAEYASKSRPESSRIFSAISKHVP